MTDDARQTGADDVAQLREELEAARAQVAQLEQQAANAVAESESLRERLAAAELESDGLASETESLRARIDEATARERDATAKFRDLLVRSEPALPADLIVGDTVDAIEASAAAARETVARVRSHIAAQAQHARVPAGAPERRPRDTSAMSPEQKIRYGLTRSRDT